MAPDEGLTSPESRTHYQVLALTPSLLFSSRDPPAVLKKAYHRALLQNHPDKAAKLSSSADRSAIHFFTVDQITQAYAVLSSPHQRAEYDNALRLSRQATKGHGGAVGEGGVAPFQTGVEVVDLDDLQLDDEKGLWYRSCRCGNDRGYLFGEQDLESVSDDGELLVGCLGCSLWLRVHFAVVEYDADDDTFVTKP